MTVSLVSSKGGCGKSCLAVNLACALAGKSTVTLVDADPQGTARHHAAKGLLPVELLSLPLEDPRGLPRWLERILAIKTGYVVVDSPPHSGLVTQALLGVSDSAIVPCPASGPDLLAAIQTVEAIRTVRTKRADGGPGCLLVPNRVDTRTVSGREIVAALEGLKEPVGPTVRQRIDFVDSFSAGQWVGDYSPGSDAHLDVQALASAVRKATHGQKTK